MRGGCRTNREKLGLVQAKLRAKHKMNCALQRNQSITQKFSDGVNGCVSTGGESSQNNKELSSLVLESSDLSRSFITFLTFEADGKWKVVLLPVQGLKHSNHIGSIKQETKMDSTDKQLDQPNVPKISKLEPAAKSSYAPKSYIGNKGVNSCDNCLGCSDFNGFLPCSSESQKAKEDAKRNSKKKARKKGKQQKKKPSSSCSISQELKVFPEECADESSTSQVNCISQELEVFPEECANGSSTSGNDTEVANGQVLCAILPPILESEVDINATTPCLDAQKSCPPIASQHGIKGKQVNKKVEKKLSAYRVSSGGNSHGGKEQHNHSIWQKKSDSNSFHNQLKEKNITNSGSSESGTILKETPLLNNVVELEVKNCLKAVKVSRKLKRKQEANNGNRKGSQVVKANSNALSKIQIQQKRRLNVPSSINDKKTRCCVSNDTVEVHEDVPSQVNQINLLSKSGDSQLDLPPFTDHETAEAEKEISPTKYSKQEEETVSTLHTVKQEDEAQIEKLSPIQNSCSRINQNVAISCLYDDGMNEKVADRSNDRITYAEKIVEAMKDVCRFRLVSEAIEMSTGSPIAEFERFLHTASPVIYLQSQKLIRKNDEILKPIISLGNLWQWYEKHGSYGLEVMANDYKHIIKNRLEGGGFDSSSFRAYFVPFLSAVQLFGNQNNKTVSSGELNDLEPLFEFFEFEQPQRRRPLFDKIKELTRGGPLRSNMYGDPTILASIDMHDLHPRSWFAVAWYPIYRIPDDNLRASFLTYHSVGQMHDKVGDDGCIVCPVVGLESYNAQSECWFEQRHHPEVVVEHESLAAIIKPWEILKERIKTLEKTASLMATASVRKGNLTWFNKHPDFDFFVSRRCC